MKRVFAILLILAVLASLVACTAASNGSTPTQTTPSIPTTQTTPDTNPAGKYPLDMERNEVIINDAGHISADNAGNARVYYQIFVGSFSDSNGDGIGDLRGIIERFDYLNDGDPNSGVSLGVEGIWLSPIFASPSYHKYDATDYYQIDAKFGTMEDLKELIDLCHSRNVQIILDLVINHSSRTNPWFQNFVEAHVNGNTENEYYDFYSWAEEKKGGATYNRINGTNHFYECNFSTDMPELNFDNPKVRQAMVDLAKFYLDLGVDGFRFDAAKYIYYGDEPRNIQFWEWYMSELRAIKPDIYTVAEVWSADGAVIPYNSSTNCFNFSMSQAEGKVAATAAGGNVNAYTKYIQNYLQQIQSQRADAMLMTFIANHDMDRAAGFLTVASGRAYVAANLSILTPGSPYIYYGEEIGMLGSRGGSNTDANRRLAMLWGDGDTVKNPVGANYGGKQSNGTVVDQLSNEKSLYNHYKKLIMIRKANPEIAYGTFQAVTGSSSKVGGFLSTYEGKTVMVLHNTTTEAVTLDISKLTDISFETLAAYVGLGVATLEGNTLTIDGQTSVVLR